MRNRKIIILVGILLIYSCGNKNETNGILPKQKFTSLLIQMHLIEADISFNQHLDQKSIEKNYEKYKHLFKKFSTDSATVSNTFDYYTDKQKELLEIYQGVLDSLNKMALQSLTKPNSK